jgi:hypothetical protein
MYDQITSLSLDKNDRSTNSGLVKKLTLRIGKITKVNPDKNTVDIEWLWPNKGSLSNLNISRPYVGLRSGIHFVPEISSIIIVGYAFDRPVMLSYLMPGDFDKLVAGDVDSNNKSSRMRVLAPGEISLMSVQNSEIYLHEKVEIRDGSADKITIDPEDGSITLDSLQLYINNECGNLIMGMVKRNDEIITNDGQAVSSTNGGNAYTEFRIKVNEFADNTVNDDTNSDIADIIVGTVIDEDGEPTTSESGNQIACQIKLSSGAKVLIDKAGNVEVFGKNKTETIDENKTVNVGKNLIMNANKINLNKGNEIIPKQKSARENDEITVPLSPAQTDINHPDLLTSAVTNQSALSSLASSFKIFGYIPCIYSPTMGPDTKLIGQITKGSDSVYIGD